METKKKKLGDISEVIMYFSYAVFVTRLIVLVIVPCEQSIYDSTAYLLLITAIVSLLATLATVMLSDTK